MKLIILALLVSEAAGGFWPRFDISAVTDEESSQVKFGRLCRGYYTNQVRDCDDQGCGGYGASRRMDGKSWPHQGIDILCDAGDEVYAPFDLTIKRQSAPYFTPSSGQKKINNGVMVQGEGGDFEGLCFQLWYVKPVKESGSLKKGEKIGEMLDMSEAYPGITSHIHVQRCDKTDPTEYF